MFKQPPVIISHWYHLIEGLQESPQNFYTLLQEAIKQRQIPNIGYDRIDYKEGGIFSARREYFRVKRYEHTFDICAAPFGNCFFISWWLGEAESFIWQLIESIPFAGKIIIKFLRPDTYYRHDTALMFQSIIHTAVLEVIDELTKAKGLRIPSELERKPILSNLFKK